jgi:hypothetical protein
MARDLFSRAARARTFRLKPRRDDWQQRQRWLAWGALLTLLPGLLLLPVIGFLLISPRFAHARVLGAVLVALIALCEVLGVPRLARCLYREFDLLAALAFGALVLLLVILMYTGIFLVSFFFGPG